MKPLFLAVISVLTCAQGFLRAQTISPTDGGRTIEELKKKYANGGQKPAASSAAPSDPSSQSGEMTIADLESLLLHSPGCKKNLADTAQLAESLKGKYGLISCHDEIDGLRQIVLVPKTANIPNQELAYGSMVGYKLLRARLVDHYLVLQFDKQVQYLDLLRQDKDLYGKDTGFSLSGFVADQSVSRFEDVGIFKDALKTYGGVAEDSEMMTKLSERVAMAVGSKRFRLQAGKVKDVWMILITSEGNTFPIWPKIVKP